MIAIWLAVFFAVVCLIAWLAMFPAARDAGSAWLDRWLRRGAATSSRLRSRAAAQASDSSQAVRGAGGRVVRKLFRHRVVLLISAAMLCLPLLSILYFRQQVALDSFAGADLEAGDSQVMALLRGERLVPPPAPPPEVFIVAEATLMRMGPSVVVPENIVSADRRWERIDPDFQQRVLAVYRVMREQYGYQMVLVEGYRSPARQAELARSGKATRAGAGQSCHQYGQAVDSAPIRDGKLQWDMDDAWTKRGYFLYGQLAAQARLEWGGSWRSLKDYVHIEMKDACRAARAG